MNEPRIAVVIPAYRVARHILEVIDGIGPEVHAVIVVDDACPENSGDLVERQCADKRVTVLRNPKNLGVGGAVIAGYQAALADGADVVIKLDGDGQMPTQRIADLVAPILNGEADYVKGNRFASLTGLRSMPGLRVFGNGILSLMTKFSTGYWNITDPTNGFTAVHRDVLKLIPLDMLSQRFFFESDLLFRLSLAKAVVQDMPMDSIYGDEKSNIKLARVLFEFPYKHAVNFHKRLFYNYYLRDMSIASLELPIGAALWWFGVIFGAWHLIESSSSGVPATSGTVMLSAVPIILGLQLILAFFGHDMGSVPNRVRHNPKKLLG